jgi:hypothetical protein
MVSFCSKISPLWKDIFCILPKPKCSITSNIIYDLELDDSRWRGRLVGKLQSNGLNHHFPSRAKKDVSVKLLRWMLVVP